MENKDPENYSKDNLNNYITIQTEKSSGGILKGLCHIFMMIGSIITFIRNTVFNIIFILLVIAIFALISFANDLADKSSEVIADFSGVSENSDRNTIQPVIYFDLSGPIYEYPLPNDEYSKFTRSLDAKINNRQINDVLTIENALKNAASMDNIKELYLDLTDCVTTLPVAERICNAFAAYKKQKPDTKIIAFAESYSASGYKIATAADRIKIDPLGGFNFKGLASANLYLKDFLDRLRIEPLVFKAGEFKSAVEMFTRNNMSEGVKEEYRHIFEALWKEYKKSVSSRDRVEKSLSVVFDDPDFYLDQLDKFRGSEAQLLSKFGFVDDIESQIKIDTDLSSAYGFDGNVLEPNMTDYQVLASDFPKKKSRKAKKRTLSSSSAVAVMYGIGEIKDYSEKPTEFTPDNIESQAEQILEDESIKAVIFYINSPGGSVSASEKIREIVEQIKLRRNIPVYVSMNSLCASGAYWISTACDRLYATDSTITGSIGVFSLGLGIHDLLNEYGVNQDGIETSELAKPSLAKSMPQSQRRMHTLEVEGIYDNFIHLVKKARPALKNVNYREFAEGKVFICKDALEMKLIDGNKTLFEVYDELKKELKQDDEPLELIHLTAENQNKSGMLKTLFLSSGLKFIAPEYIQTIVKLLDSSNALESNKPKLMAIGAIRDLNI